MDQEPGSLADLAQSCNDAAMYMNEGASLLLASPHEVLLPFQDRITAINDHIRALLSDISKSGTWRDALMIRAQSQESTSFLPILPSNRIQSHPSRQPELFEDLLTSAIAQFEPYIPELLSIQVQTPDLLIQDPRIMHLHPILALQCKRKARSIKLYDRLLLVCSCMSLADDFHAFEKSRGWSSKQEILIAGFLSDCVPAIQKIGKHLRSFLATMNTNVVDERRLDAGVRLGTKLNVIEAISSRYGLGSSLTLVLGFEISKLSRLSYKALTALKAPSALDEGIDSILSSSEGFGLWWSEFRRSYSSRFANIRSKEKLENPLGDAPNIDCMSNGFFTRPQLHQEIAPPFMDLEIISSFPDYANEGSYMPAWD
ncbi:hypothetical protein D6D11_06791 [Aureobasidium pullulans]|nr:hypothetical protein D6D11_06791 [Aureobasidium pullulans]